MRKAAQTHIEALADSIRQIGLTESICVRPLREGAYQIIAGEYRWRAAKLAGLVTITSRVREVTEDQAFVLVENLQGDAFTALLASPAYWE